MVISLVCSEGELCLAWNEVGWCEVVLVASGQRYQLGAETKDIVVARLSDGLDKKLEGQASGSIENVEVRWVLSLAERHYSIYAAEVSNRRVLFFQGPDGGLVGKLSLDPEERSRWCQQLRWKE